ncbi:MAG: lysine--tRNA ligase [Desulfosalsimonas sp.]
MTQAKDVITRRKEKIESLKEEGVELFPNDFKATHAVADIQNAIEAADEQITGGRSSVRAAGRIMAINRFGKSAFIRFRDRSGQMQAYIRQDRVGRDAYAFFKKLDIGDFIGLQGNLFTTKTGEWTLLADEFRLLAKAYRPLPEKFHGLKDPEKRYRQRYLDLVMNPEVKEVFLRRSMLIREIRDFLTARDYLEVETPMMQPVAGGADARPFKTHHNALDMDLYLRIAPELYLKRLVVGGFERVFEINRNFRNEGISTQHNPEFTMLEFYQAYADYEIMMELTEQLVSQCAEEVLGTKQIPWGEGEEATTIDLTTPWKRLPFKEGLRNIGIDPDDEAACREKAKQVLASNADKNPVDNMDHDHVLDLLFGELVEPTIMQPTFVTNQPVGLTPLCKANCSDNSVHDRFEVIVCGMEMANAYSEQNDPLAQREAFSSQLESKDADGADYGTEIDEDFCSSLEVGMPPAGGLGIGIDRLVMLLTNRPNVREVILFPTLKPKLQAEVLAEQEAAEAEVEGEEPSA